MALVIFAAAFALRLVLLPVDSGFRFLTFYPAMTLGFLLCGVGPGLLISALAAACGVLIFSGPHIGGDAGAPLALATLIYLASSVPLGVMVSRLADARREVARQARRQNALLAAQPVGIATIKDRHIVWANAGMERLFGYAPGGLAGTPTRVAYPSEAAHAALGAAAYPVLQAGGTFRSEIQMCRKDGALFWVNLSASMLPDADGVSLWTFVDVDQWKRTQADLAVSRKFLERVGRAAGVGGWQLDLATERVLWSDETCRLHDCPPGFTPNLAQALAFYAPASRERILAAVRQCIDTGAPWDLELELVSATGRRFWARAVGEAECEDGRPVRMFGAFQDITSAREAAQALQESQTRLQLALDCAKIGIWEMDLAAGATWYDNRVSAMTQGVLAAGQWIDWHGPELSAWEARLRHGDRAARAAAIEALREGTEDSLDICYAASLEGGREVWLALRGVGVERDPQSGRFRRALGVIMDITEQQSASERLRAQDEQARRQAALLKTIYETAKVGLSFVDTELRIVEMNAFVSELFGREIEACLGKTRSELGTPRADYVEGLIRQVLETGAPLERHEFSAALAGDPGRPRNWLMSLYPVFDADGRTLGVGQAVLEITAQKRLEQALLAANAKLEKLARTDALTGLANRRGFDEALARACAAAARHGHDVSLVLVDIDRFKLFNDRYGHPQGDACLRMVAGALADAGRRPEDVVARFGGEEFAILLPATDAAGAAHVAGLALGGVRSLRIPHEANEGCGGVVTASFGVASLAGGGAPGALVAEADAMLYAAKREGRNCVRQGAL